MPFTNAGSVARAGVVAGLILRAIFVSSCTSTCGLKLVQRISFSSDPKRQSEPPTPVPCCGAFRYQDVDLTARVIQQVDLANAQVNAGHVDAFLTAATCARLFDGAYDGSAVQPLCKVYIGPVSAGMVSPRQTLPSGIYRVFVQAWALNDTANLFSADVGIWSDDCAAQRLIGP